VKRILFVCIHNSGRSQMAEAFTRHYADNAIDVASAGTMPSDRINPVVAQVMLEQGIDLSASRPKLLTAEIADRADRLITMGCSIEESCPVQIGAEDWGLDDPAGKPADEVRRIRDVVEHKVKLMLEEELDAGCRGDASA
jgi:arsenate reductase